MTRTLQSLLTVYNLVKWLRTQVSTQTYRYWSNDCLLGRFVLATMPLPEKIGHSDYSHVYVGTGRDVENGQTTAVKNGDFVNNFLRLERENQPSEKAVIPQALDDISYGSAQENPARPGYFIDDPSQWTYGKALERAKEALRLEVTEALTVQGLHDWLKRSKSPNRVYNYGSPDQCLITRYVRAFGYKTAIALPHVVFLFNGLVRVKLPSELDNIANNNQQHDLKKAEAVASWEGANYWKAREWTYGHALARAKAALKSEEIPSDLVSPNV